MGKSWKKRSADQLWLKVLAQIVVAGNAAPGYILENSRAVKRKLAISQLKALSKKARRRRIHCVLRAISTRYVGKSVRKSKKVDAAVHNFGLLMRAGGPKQFFKQVASEQTTKEKAEFLKKKLAFYRTKGARDTLIELRLADDCMALDQRIKRLLEAVGARISGSVESQYERIEQELIERVAERCGLTGGELDRILFQNYGDIMVQLLCS